MNYFTDITAGKTIDRSPDPKYFPMHIHNNYEIFYFLSGDASYIVEGSIYPLHKGDLVLMRSAEAHHIRLQSASAYKRMVTNFLPAKPISSFVEKLLSPFHNRSLGQFNHYPAVLLQNSHIPYYMEQLCAFYHPDIRSSYLTVLLCELCEQFKKLQQSSDMLQPKLYTNIITYINQNLTEPLSLHQISETFFISESQLNRTFRQLIGSTVWEYITTKRLLLAKQQIEEGGNPTKIYLDCGFNDYTTFYRAYRSHFGFSPSKTEQMHS